MKRFTQIKKACGKINKHVSGIHPEAFQLLLDYHWPGNVRELGNYCEQIAIAGAGCSGLRVPDNVLQALRRKPEPRAGGAIYAGREVIEVSDSEVREAMREARWEVTRAARSLKISRQALYKRIDAIPELRVAADIPGAEIETVFHECRGDLDDAAARLQVSRTGLRRRLRAMELLMRDY